MGEPLKNAEVKLRVDNGGDAVVYEHVPAKEIGPNRFRILASPGFALGLASGDEIEFLLDLKDQYRVTRRSGNICVQLFLRACTAGDRSTILEIVQSLNGWLDGGLDSKIGNERLLIFTIPVNVGFPAIEPAMAEIENRFAVDRWMYGNVYDPTDGTTPLNWWLD